MMQKPKKKSAAIDIDEKAAVQALEYLLAAGYVSKKRLYFNNFVRGIFFSVGTIVGATIVVALVIWLLSVFDGLPVIGDFFRKISDTISQQ